MTSRLQRPSWLPRWEFETCTSTIKLHKPLAVLVSFGPCRRTNSKKNRVKCWQYTLLLSFRFIKIVPTPWGITKEYHLKKSKWVSQASNECHGPNFRTSDSPDELLHTNAKSTWIFWHVFFRTSSSVVESRCRCSIFSVIVRIFPSIIPICTLEFFKACIALVSFPFLSFNCVIWKRRDVVYVTCTIPTPSRHLVVQLLN